jgi:hypothetical protein
MTLKNFMESKLYFSKAVKEKMKDSKKEDS